MIKIKRHNLANDKGRSNYTNEFSQKKFLANQCNMNYLSPNQREEAMNSGDEDVINHVKLGDKHHKEKYYQAEAGEHRHVQEKIKIFNDPESNKAYNWNSNVIHSPHLFPFRG